MLEYERRVADSALRLTLRLPVRIQRRVLLALPTILACIPRPIRIVLGFCAFLAVVPLLFWPPFWRK
jgi:hypothetical protein